MLTNRLNLSIDRKKQFILINLAVVNTLATLSYSLISPFFPEEAKKKDVSETITGLIFGEFELVIVVTSFFFGKYLPVIGGKFMYVAGMFLEGSCSILFGVLTYCPPGPPFIIMCFIVRAVIGLAASMSVTASFAIISDTFPDRVATMFGFLELFTGVGLMIGPLVGGFLYEFGGFQVPLVTIGLLSLLGCLFTLLFLPYESAHTPSKSNFFRLAKIPQVWLVALNTVGCCIGFGFINPTFQPFLAETFNLTPSIVGIVFLAIPIPYALFSPFWGYIVDRYDCPKVMMITGNFICSVCFMLIAPSPLLNLESHLWSTICAAFLFGLFAGLCLVPTVNDLLTEAKLHGFEDNFETYSMVSGFITPMLSLGFFIGPVAGGAMTEKLGFGWSTTIVGGISMFLALVTLIALLISKWNTPRGRAKSRSIRVLECGDTDEATPLLQSREVEA